MDNLIPDIYLERHMKKLRDWKNNVENFGCMYQNVIKTLPRTSQVSSFGHKQFHSLQNLPDQTTEFFITKIL